MNGAEPEDVPDFAGLLRSRDRCAVDEGGSGGLGRRKQSLPPGRAKETDDPDVVAATMAKPGVILRRPAGSSGRFAEHADLPTDLDGEQPRSRNGKGRPKPKKEPAPKMSEKAARKAALAFEKEQRQREAERRREQAARAKELERRDKAIAKAQGALEKAEREHATKAAAVRAEAEALEKRSRAEDVRWDAERERLQTALRRARG